MKKKKKNYLYIIISILFFIFIIIYFIKESGYYNYYEYNKTILTKEAIEKFEEDVKNGEVLDTNVYLENINKSYTNKFSEAGINTSNTIEKLMNNVVKSYTKIFKTLFVN